MKRFFLSILLVAAFCTQAMAQTDALQTDNEMAKKAQLLSQTFSRYLVNNMTIHLKSIRYLESTRKMQQGFQMKMSVLLNKNGRIEDVIVYQGLNEIFDSDFRDELLTMPKTEYESLTLTGKERYIPILMDVKMVACDRKFAERMEDEMKSKRWKRFDLNDEELIKQFPKLAEYKSVPDQCYSTVWYVYYRLMNLTVKVADASDLISHELNKVPQPQESAAPEQKKKKQPKYVESEE